VAGLEIEGVGWKIVCSRTWRIFARSVPMVKPNGMIKEEERGGQSGRVGRRRRR
jgi:hypothetical protein